MMSDLREDLAVALFDARPHNHPQGHIPQWGIQPASIKAVFYREADTCLALLRASGRLAPAVEGDVVEAALDQTWPRPEYNEDYRDEVRAIIEKAAPIIAAATEARIAGYLKAEAEMNGLLSVEDIERVIGLTR